MSTEHGDEQGPRPRIRERKPELDRRLDGFEGRQAGPNPVGGVLRCPALTFCARPREERLDLPEPGNQLLFLVEHHVPPLILSRCPFPRTPAGRGTPSAAPACLTSNSTHSARLSSRPIKRTIRGDAVSGGSAPLRPTLRPRRSRPQSEQPSEEECCRHERFTSLMRTMVSLSLPCARVEVHSRRRRPGARRRDRMTNYPSPHSRRVFLPDKRS